MKRLSFEYPSIYSFSTRKEYKDFVLSLSEPEKEKIQSWHSPEPLLYFYATKKVLHEDDFWAIIRVAANPTIEEELLSTLYKYALQFPNPHAAIQILHHPHLSESFVSEETHVWKKNIWTSVVGYGEILSAVALAHPSISNPAETLYSSIKNIYYAAPHRQTRNSTSGSRNKTKSLFTQEELFLECLLIPEVKTHSQVLHSLFTLSNTSLINSIPASSAAETGLLSGTGGGYNPFEWVSEKVVQHPNCSSETLLLLFHTWENSSKQLDAVGNQNSSFLDYHYSISGLKKLVLEVLKRQDCPAFFLKQACWSGSDEIRRIASQHKNCADEDAVAAVLLPNDDDSLFL